MTAAELREALEVWEPADPYRNDAMLDAIIDAARLWLRILEGDEQMVEKVRAVLQRNWEDQAPDAIAELDARAVLAAITEGSGE